jgi:hypothetical protein
MVAEERRLTRALLVNWIWTLSLLLIVCGLVTFVLFLDHPESDRWSQSAKLIGATLFQVGAVSLILELVNIDRLVGLKVPEALLGHGYLDSLRDERLDDLIERAVHARFAGLAPEDVRRGRRWLLESLSAPSRRDYTVTLELRDEAIVEPFAGDGRPPPDALCVQVTYEYGTDVNSTDKPILINGNGVVQVFRNTVPESLEFARRFRAGELGPDDQVAWVNAMARPRIELRPGSSGSPIVVDPEIANLLVTRGDDKLLLAFEVRCSHLVPPGERIRVTYTHREFVERHGYFPWQATARTHNLRFKTVGFDGFDTHTIPAPSLPAEDDKVEVFNNGLYYRGVLYPNSTFTFVWSERPRQRPGR